MSSHFETLTSKERLIWRILCTDHNKTSLEEIASLYDVSVGTVRNVKLLKTRIALRVCGEASEEGVEVFLLERAKRLNKVQVTAIRRSTEVSHKIAARYGVSPSTIRMIRTGKTYNGV